MRLLILAGIRHYLRHRWQGILALSGVVLGVAIVLAVDLANSSARNAFLKSASQLQGAATHRITGIAGDFDEAVYAKLFTLPLAPPMLPGMSAEVRLPGDDREPVQLHGVDFFAAMPFQSFPVEVSDLQGNLLDWLTLPGAVLMSEELASQLGIAQGEAFTVSWRGEQVELKAAIIVSSEPPLVRQSLIADIATLQEITGRYGRLDRIDLILDKPAADLVAGQLPPGVRLDVIEATAEGVTRLSEAFELNLTAMSLLALLVGIFLIYNAISFSLVQRRIEIGRLRAVGVTERQILAGVLLEALVIGITGTLIGVAGGTWLGTGLTAIVASTISELYYRVTVDAMTLSTWSLIKASVLGILATLAAALIPAYRASKTTPISALSRSTLERQSRKRLPLLGVAGSLLLLAGILIVLLEIPGVITGFIAIFLAVIGAAMLTPLLLPLVSGIMRQLRLPLEMRMAFRDLDRHHSRLGIAAAALMVALSAGIGVGIMVNSMRSTVDSWLTDLLNADIYITDKAFFDEAVLAPPLVDKIHSLQAVETFSSYRQRTLRLGDREIRLIATRLSQPSRDGFDLLGGDAGSWKAFDRGGIMISEPLAFHTSKLPGDTLLLPTPAGPLPFRIAGIFRDFASEHGRIFMNRDAYIDRWHDHSINSMALFARDDDVAALIERLRELDTGNRLALTPSGTILDESLKIFDRTFRITEVLRVLALGVAFIGILSALMALQIERTKEYAVLRALGFCRAEIARLIAWGAFLLGSLASMASIPAGLLMSWMLIHAVQRQAFGWTLPFEADWQQVMETLIIGITASALAVLYPAWRSAMSRPASFLREE